MTNSGAGQPGGSPVPGAAERLPFGPVFQQALFRLLLEDVAFATAVAPHLQPGYFEAEPLCWAYAQVEAYQKAYQAIPRLNVLQELARQLPQPAGTIYQVALEQVGQADLTAEKWLRDKTLEFVKRNIFVRAFRGALDTYNRGDFQAAYTTVTEAMDLISRAEWEVEDREWLFDNFSQRYSDRLAFSPEDDAISTGILTLDKVLQGGIHEGELGIWLGDAKAGKTTLLTNLGAQAVKRGLQNVLHVIYEGSRRQVAAKYDTIFAQEPYKDVRRSGISEQVFRRMIAEYRMYSGRLLLQSLVQDWNYTVADLQALITRLKQQYHWVPTLLVVDYGDLLRGRGRHDSETAHQMAAYRDLKTLVNRGYRAWTASQTTRPKKVQEDDSEVRRSKDSANCYDKVRVADIIGSVNRTREERMNKRARLYVELYRDAEADVVIPVYADYERQVIANLPGESSVPLGYVQTSHGLPLPTQRALVGQAVLPETQEDIPF
ncbi:MAG: DnaB-like helicase C-terminal domain-containing protein [Lentisphaeria bacterium]